MNRYVITGNGFDTTITTRECYNPGDHITPTVKTTAGYMLEKATVKARCVGRFDAEEETL